MSMWIVIISCFLVHLWMPAWAVDEAVLKFRQQRANMRVAAYLEEGKKELQRGSYMRAIRLLSMAIGSAQGDEAVKLRGQAYYLSGMYPEAIADLTRAIQNSPSDPAAYNLLGDVFLAKGDYLKALESYDKAINADPLFVDAYVGRGIVYVSLEKYGLAIRDFQVALQSVPTDEKALTNLALACVAADMPLAGRLLAEKIAPADRRPSLDTLLDQNPSKRNQSSSFEEKVGSLAEYTTKTAGTYEGAATTMLCSSAKRPDSDAPSFTPGKDLKSLKINSLANIQERISTKIRHARTPNSREFSGTWDGTYMGLKWTIDFKTHDQNVSAVLKIYSPAGKEDVHYCEGVIRQDGYLQASDSKGFRFVGKLTEDYRLIGTITRNDGKSFDLDMPIE